MNMILYRLYSTFPEDNHVFLTAWLNENGSRHLDFYKKTIEHYQKLPVDRRLMAELQIDELFTENEACRLKHYLGSISTSIGFTMKTVCLPLRSRRRRTSLRTQILKMSLPALRISHICGKDIPAPPFPVKPVIIDAVRIPGPRRR